MVDCMKQGTTNPDIHLCKFCAYLGEPAPILRDDVESMMREEYIKS